MKWISQKKNFKNSVPTRIHVSNGKKQITT